MNTELRLRMQEVLAKAFNGTLSAYYVHLGDGALARLQFIIATTPGQIPEVDLKDLEVEARRRRRAPGPTSCAMRWSRPRARRRAWTLLRRYRDAFPAGYDDAFQRPRRGPRHRAGGGGAAPGRARHQPLSPDRGRAATSCASSSISAKDKIALSTVLPSLENFGLKVISEIPFDVQAGGRGQAGLDPRLHHAAPRTAPKSTCRRSATSSTRPMPASGRAMPRMTGSTAWC